MSSEGSVIEVKSLRSTASFDELMIGVVRGWQFAPAERQVDFPSPDTSQPKTRPVGLKVLVAWIFRPPALYSLTLGEPITDVASPFPEVPFPAATVMPPTPPNI